MVTFLRRPLDVGKGCKQAGTLKVTESRYVTNLAVACFAHEAEKMSYNHLAYYVAEPCIQNCLGALLRLVVRDLSGRSAPCYWTNDTDLFLALGFKYTSNKKPYSCSFMLYWQMIYRRWFMSEVRIVTRGVDTVGISVYYTDQGHPR